MTVAPLVDPEVSITIARDPALVRTVRLVAAAVARRADCDDSLIEEIRLAVGEGCAVMVGAEDAASRRQGRVRVHIQIRDGFRVTVTGQVEDPDDEFDGMGLEPWALLRGLCEDLRVSTEDGCTVLSMSWPL